MAAKARRLPHEHEGAFTLNVDALALAIGATLRDPLMMMDPTESGAVMRGEIVSYRGDQARGAYLQALSFHLAEIIAFHYRAERLEQITGKPAEVQP